MQILGEKPRELFPISLTQSLISGLIPQDREAAASQIDVQENGVALTGACHSESVKEPHSPLERIFFVKAFGKVHADLSRRTASAPPRSPGRSDHQRPSAPPTARGTGLNGATERAQGKELPRIGTIPAFAREMSFGGQEIIKHSREKERADQHKGEPASRSHAMRAACSGIIRFRPPEDELRGAATVR